MLNFKNSPGMLKAEARQKRERNREVLKREWYADRQEFIKKNGPIDMADDEYLKKHYNLGAYLTRYENE